LNPKSKESSRHIDVVLRALDILDCFQQKSELTLKEIIDHTGLTRSRAMRLLGTLESRGYLMIDYRNHKYLLGVKTGILGNAFEQTNPMEVIIRPVLKELAGRTGESATFYVIDNKDRLVFAREEGTHAIRYSVREGQRMPLHAGASGKVLLAYGPAELLSDILSTEQLSAITVHTITDPEILRQEIEAVRKRGYALSKSENVPDANAIAAPVIDHSGKLVGSLGIAAPVHRLNDQNFVERAKIVMDASAGLSRQFGCVDEPPFHGTLG